MLGVTPRFLRGIPRYMTGGHGSYKENLVAIAKFKLCLLRSIAHHMDECGAYSYTQLAPQGVHAAV